MFSAGFACFCAIAQTQVAAASGAVHLSLGEAVKRGLQHDRQVLSSKAKLQSAANKRKSVRGRFGPMLKADGRALFWEENAEKQLIDIESLQGNLGSNQQAAAILGPLLPELPATLEVREKETYEANLTVVQPITPLYSVYQGYQMARAGEHAAASKLQRDERFATFQIVKSYFQLAKARQMRDVAKAAVETIGAHVDQARQFQNAGVVQVSAVLSAKVELAQAQEKLIRAKEAVELTQAMLAKRIGLPLNASIEIEPLHDKVPKRLRFSLSGAQNLAVKNRSDLKILGKLAEVEEHRTQKQWWELVPKVSAVAGYKYVKGIPLQPRESYFVGGIMEWEVWDWGRNYYEAQAAESQAEGSRLQFEEAKEMVQLEVKKNFLAFGSALQRLDVTATALGQAKENLRLEQLRFKQSLATSTDVLDAQTRLTAAQGNVVAARTDAWIAFSALRLALGEGSDPNVADELKKATSK